MPEEKEPVVYEALELATKEIEYLKIKLLFDDLDDMELSAEAEQYVLLSLSSLETARSMMKLANIFEKKACNN